nr:hypothetical protein [Tanacetum cinerariifolium]
MDVPLLLDHAFDFFAVERVPGLAELPNNQNGWIEWDVPLGGEMDKPIDNLWFDKEEELNEFMDDDQDEEVEEWLMAPVTPLRATIKATHFLSLKFLCDSKINILQLLSRAMECFKNSNTHQIISSNIISFYHRLIKEVIFNHTNFSMTTLADKAILLGADNRPPMLEKDMYDSWKSRMELYMMNRQHGRMILKFVENGPLIWPSIEENGVTRPNKYSKLSATEAIQADCDVKATNIILQGLLPEVYALFSNHKVAKELWERIQLFMQGTSLKKQERETLMLAEESCSKMLLKQKDPMMSEKKVNTKPNSMNSKEPNPSTRPTQVEVPKELPKVSMVNTSLKKLKHHLASLDVVVKERTTATAITEEVDTQPNQSQEKDMVIKKFKERIKSLSGNIEEDKIKQELEEIETINIELDHRVTKLIAENEHLKQTYNLQEKVLIITALRDTLRKLKGKVVVDEAVILHPIDPELLKVDVAPLAPKLRNNRTARSDYLKHTQKETATLREIVEHERSLNPLNTSLDYLCCDPLALVDKFTHVEDNI